MSGEPDKLEGPIDSGKTESSVGAEGPDNLEGVETPETLGEPETLETPEDSASNVDVATPIGRRRPETPGDPAEEPFARWEGWQRSDSSEFVPRSPDSSWTYLKEAWRDFVQPGTSALPLVPLVVASCVPVADFFVTGYALSWGRELCFDKRKPISDNVFALENFMLALKSIVVSVPYTLAFFLVSLLISFVTLGIGLIALVPLAFVFVAFVNVCCMRMAVVGRMGAAFNLKAIRWAMKGTRGLYAGALVPGIVAGLISYAITFALSLALDPQSVYDLTFGDNCVNIYELLYSAVMGRVTPCMITSSLVDAVLAVPATLVSMRAIGHWAAFAAPEWTREADQR